MLGLIVLAILVVDGSIAIAHAAYWLTGWSLPSYDFKSLLLYVDICILLAGFLGFLYEKFNTETQ